jgi:hypothetical protein
MFSPSFLIKLTTWAWEGLHLIIPAFILNWIADHFEDIVEFFRSLCKRFIDWVNLPNPSESKDIINSVD